MKVDYERHAQARLFESDFLERSSKIHPATPFLFYVPVVLALLGYGLYAHTVTLLSIALALPLGYVTWEFMEYFLHRHFFHWEGNGPFTRKVHEIIHGYHHKYPDDPDRLVMPLGASIPLAIVIGGLLWLAGVPRFTIPYFCGVVIGYMVYDFMHFAVHALPPRTAWGKNIRSHHMAHHFANPAENFGISNRWIDVLMGTLKRRERREG